MRIAILSSFPLADKLSHKVNFLRGILTRNFVSDIIVIYSHSSIFDHYKEFRKRLYNIKLKSKTHNVNLSEIASNESLSNFAKQNGIKVYKFNRFSDNKCVELLKSYNCDLAHNFSGEFVPKTILSLPKNGILSAHYGKLPEIRGGDTIRWTIYLNYPMYVSHFFLAPVLDMGDIALLTKITVNKGDTVYTIRKKCQMMAFEGHLKILDTLRNGNLELFKQKPEMGTTYYSMGKYLTRKVDEILKNNLYGHYEE